MFIAKVPRQGASPQRGDMFIAGPRQTTILHSRRRRMQRFVSTLLCHKCTGRNMSPRWGEEIILEVAKL
jgi:hypothetical protein